MNDFELKLECLKLAAADHGKQPETTVAAASSYWRFVSSAGLSDLDIRNPDAKLLVTLSPEQRQELRERYSP